jgi:hypothetical protein
VCSQPLLVKLVGTSVHAVSSRADCRTPHCERIITVVIMVTSRRNAHHVGVQWFSGSPLLPLRPLLSTSASVPTTSL